MIIIQFRGSGSVGTPEEKREMLVTIGSNLTLLDKVLGVDLENEYAFLEYVKEIEPTVSEEFEHEKSVDLSMDFESLWAQNRLVLPRMVGVRTREWVSCYLFDISNLQVFRPRVVF